MSPRSRPALGALLVLLVALSSCAHSGGPSRMPGAATVVTYSTVHASSRLTGWPTYHHDTRRSGVAPAAARPPLHRLWRASLTGAVNGEPLLVHGTLVVATERNWVYGLNPVTGHRRWSRHLGIPMPLADLPCGDIGPLGITGTPAYDAATGSVFVVPETTGGHHTLWALDAANGHRRWHRSLDVLPNRNRRAEQQRSALLVTHNRVVVTFGGLDGDCANYVGYATSVPTTGSGPTHHYAVPTAREAGMWAPGGPVVGANGNVYVASGNGAANSGHWDKSDSVTELTPVGMHRVAAFAPASWRQDNAQDLDLGSSSPVPVNHRIVIAGKRGVVYLLRRALGGVGAAVASRGGCRAFGGAAHVGDTVLLPCKGSGTVRAVTVGLHSLHWKWTASNLGGSPVVGGAYAYVPDPDSGDLVVLRLATGHVVQRLHAGALTHFPSAALSGGLVFLPTLAGVTAFSGS